MLHRTRVRSGRRASRRRMAYGDGASAAHPLLRLQRQLGNQAVQRLIQREAAGDKKPGHQITAFATIKLAKQGELRGESKAPGHEGKVELLSLSQDAAELQRNSREKADSVGLMMTKATDRVTPLLVQAVAQGEPVESAKFEMVKSDDKGKLTTQATFEFKNGMFTSYEVSDGGFGPMEQLSMTAPRKS